ncbi:hypothetical protein AAF712_004162 [Marasmius tenuissimus]|uniref:Uncharacterized protein n=1 Tax=Marasmius tenuissimus TaxID=585030 RepID=A0ABR3A4M9_9AGAR
MLVAAAVWADQLPSGPQPTQSQSPLKRPSDSEEVSTPSKRPRPSNQPSPSSHLTPEQRQRRLENIEHALSQARQPQESPAPTSQEFQPPSTPTRTSGLSQRPKENRSQFRTLVKIADSESDEEGDLLTPGGLSTPPRSALRSSTLSASGSFETPSQPSKGKEKMTSPKPQILERAGTSSRFRSNHAESIELTPDEYKSLAHELEQKLFAEISKNSRLQVKIERYFKHPR